MTIDVNGVKSYALDCGKRKTEEVNDGVDDAMKDYYYDLSSPREWLEYWEMYNQCHGAYTVIRCDYDFDTNQWMIWGKAFHFERLQNSFNQMMTRKDIKNLKQIDDSKSMIADSAILSSECALEDLLQSAMEEILSKQQDQQLNMNDEDVQDKNIITFMLTILWTPEGVGSEDEYGIQVLAHLFSSLVVCRKLDYNPYPIVASIALIPPSSSFGNNLKESVQDTLPNRYDNMPTAKLSSWCRCRRPLEKRFKTNDIDEVLLIRRNDDGIELLEGLTTNLFILYKDGSLRTPDPETRGVLNGYARHLVLQYTQKHFNTKLNVDTSKPIQLEDPNLWQECFVTSSIRLIVPIHKIVARDDDNDNDVCTNASEQKLRTIWEANPQLEATPIWRQIFERVCSSAI